MDAVSLFWVIFSRSSFWMFHIHGFIIPSAINLSHHTFVTKRPTLLAKTAKYGYRVLLS